MRQACVNEVRADADDVLTLELLIGDDCSRNRSLVVATSLKEQRAATDRGAR